MKKLKLLVLMAVAVFVFALVGCNSHNGVPRDFNVKVTYCFNGGSINEYKDTTELSLYYRQGSLIAEPGVSTSELPVPKRTGYSIGGWYYAQTDENGKVVRDDDGNPIASDKKFDFKTDRTEKNDIWLVARWDGKIKVYFENLYMKGLYNNCYSYAYQSGQAFNRPTFQTSWKDKVERDIVGYFWTYDKDTDEYSDPIEFGNLTFDDLSERLSEEPDMEGEYVILKVYVKLAQV